jgi:hypothetical protein
MKTLRKRHPNLSEDRIEEMANEHIGWLLPETRFTMPQSSRSQSRAEIIRSIFRDNPDGKNEELIPKISDQFKANDFEVDRVWIARQLSNLRREMKDERWEAYRRFTLA